MKSRLSSKLAEERISLLELDRSILEKKDLEERLEEASLRYMRSEKKLERLKSPIAQKLENGQVLGGKKKAANLAVTTTTEKQTNGTVVNQEQNAELESAYQQKLAAFEKQREQITKLEEDNAKLTTQVTEISVKVWFLLG